MNQLEQNIVVSFKRAKTDIINLQKQVMDLRKKHEEILLKLKQPTKTVEKIKTVPGKVRTRTVTKVVTKKAKKVFVASKEGKKFHIKDCPFAQQIKPKTRIVIKTKNSALNKGYKPCKCI